MKNLDRIELFLYGFILLSLPLSNTALWIGVCLVYLFTLYRIVIRRDWRYRRTPLDIPFLTFLGLVFLSFFYSSAPDLTLKSLRKMAFFFLYFPTVMYFSQWLDRRQTLYRLLSLPILSGVATGVYASVRFLSDPEEGGYGFYGGRSTLAILMAVLLIAAISLGAERVVLPKKRLPRRLCWWLILLVLLSGLLVSLGRGAWVGALGAILAYAVLKKKKSVWLLAGVAAVCGMLVPAVRQRVFTLIHPLEHMSGRESIYRGASEVLWQKPILGFGFGTFKAVYPLPNPHNYGDWHNLYLEYYLNLGFVGCALFGYLVVQIFRVGRWVLQSDRIKDFQKELCLCVLLTMFALYLMGFFSLSTHDLPMVVLQGFYFGLLSSLGRTARQTAVAGDFSNG